MGQGRPGPRQVHRPTGLKAKRHSPRSKGAQGLGGGPAQAAGPVPGRRCPGVTARHPAWPPSSPSRSGCLCSDDCAFIDSMNPPAQTACGDQLWAGGLQGLVTRRWEPWGPPTRKEGVCTVERWFQARRQRESRTEALQGAEEEAGGCWDGGRGVAPGVRHLSRSLPGSALGRGPLGRHSRLAPKVGNERPLACGPLHPCLQPTSVH